VSAFENLVNVISEALDTEPVSDVLGVLAGCLIGLATELARRSGNDPGKAITIEGGVDERRLTIHALSVRDQDK